jgi:HTH-type transcriptional regulator, sugar sensing transcriptional regulator
MSTEYNLLQKIGLDEKEAKVYVASLKIGKATAEQLAKEAGILRTTTYHQINSLMERGLMTSFTVGKKPYYICEAPTNLTRLLDAEEQNIITNRRLLSDQLPELLSLFSKTGDRPAVRFFPGKAGLVAMREEVLTMEGSELLIVSTYDKFVSVFTEEEREKFSKRRNARKISTRVLYTKNPLEDKATAYTPKKYAPLNVRVMPDTNTALAFDIYIFDNAVCLSSLQDDLWGVMITGKAVSESVRVLYEVAWGASEALFF